jgi:hypothetical protein
MLGYPAGGTCGPAMQPDIAELQAGGLQEFVRQLDGGEPRPWAGPVD